MRIKIILRVIKFPSFVRNSVHWSKWRQLLTSYLHRWVTCLEWIDVSCRTKVLSAKSLTPNRCLVFAQSKNGSLVCDKVLHALYMYVISFLLPLQILTFHANFTRSLRCLIRGSWFTCCIYGKFTTCQVIDIICKETTHLHTLWDWLALCIPWDKSGTVTGGPKLELSASVWYPLPFFIFNVDFNRTPSNFTKPSNLSFAWISSFL